ncbi:hypothetical protein [Kitasatospora sp. NPDC096204]|uniref:hypothetical protein n=1 Tax=Kitasatospora sp. NPDC096204 TaxID=3364094 RepID=UPI003811D56D
MTSPADAPGTGERVPLTPAQRAGTAVLLAETADSLPGAVVPDVGPTTDPYDPAEHRAVAEANQPWFAHCHAADPEQVLDVVLRAAGPAG